MFDPHTRTLIQGAPPLPDLDLVHLPQEMTEAFASIVSLRLQLTGGTASVPDDVSEKLSEFQRLASTYEGYVALIPDATHQRAAAFVAAQAYHLIELGKQTLGVTAAGIPPIRAEAISPVASALHVRPPR